MKKIAFFFLLVLLNNTSHASRAIIEPINATSSVGSFTTYGAQYTIDQSGLSDSYVSGVTDFDNFTLNTTTVSGANSFKGWFAPANTIVGNIDFNLGGLFRINGFALWNDHQISTGQGINSFKLWADTNSTFSSAISLGSYNAVMTAERNNIGQIFNFGKVDASYLRLEILSNHGSTFTTGFSEAAVAVVPVPAAIWFFGSAFIGLVGMKRKIT